MADVSLIAVSMPNSFQGKVFSGSPLPLSFKVQLDVVPLFHLGTSVPRSFKIVPRIVCEKKSRNNRNGRQEMRIKQVDEDTSVGAVEGTLSVKRKDFPASFVFGVGTSAVQVEGGVTEGGRGLSIWDTFAQIPGHIADGSLPTISSDHYHKFGQDILQMKKLGVDGYRFSISWPRLFPDGSGNVNPEGVAFYNALINSVIMAGLEPFVTLYHWETPQVLENDPDVKGWRERQVIKHYLHFADTCFKNFGDRVKNWTTFNEVHIFTIFGYGTGLRAPGRCSEASGRTCPTGNSSTEPYIVAHNCLLAHAAAVKLYRTKYKEEQRGTIGFTADITWCEPYSERQEDIDAAERYQEFETGWLLDPIFKGDYPETMRRLVKDRLPRFTQEESKDLKASVDFIGVNYYTANFARNTAEEKDPKKKWWGNDMAAELSIINAGGIQIGEQMGPSNSWLYNCPWGLNKVLRWVEERYGRIPIYITENGTMDREAEAPLERAVDDEDRMRYMKAHLKHLAEAIREEKRNVKGYFAWAFMDNWEWSSGFTFRFGLFHVDFNDKHRRRYPKSSANWFSKFLEK